MNKLAILLDFLENEWSTIFYKYTETKIDIVMIFDNRMNPESLIKEIED